jgi:hypothetical protein
MLFSVSKHFRGCIHRDEVSYGDNLAENFYLTWETTQHNSAPVCADFGGIFRMKRICLLCLLCVFIALSLYGINVSAANYNYGEALQKAIYFYECQQAGPIPTWNRAKQWRGNSSMGDAITGGWYTDGGYANFGLPMAYSAAMLGWSMYEYPSGFAAVAQTDALKNNLKFALDYFVKCDKGTSLVYQIGNAELEHSWWGPAEVRELKNGIRPIYECKASCVTAQTAAALAIGYCIFKDNSYLNHAIGLFILADTTLSDADYIVARGYYNSWSGFYDDLIWAAVWLYLATNDISYLNKAESYVAQLDKQPGTNDIRYQWGMNYDDVRYAALLLLARYTGKQVYHDFIKKHLDWWTGYNGSVTYTSGGLAWLTQWGALSYAANEAFLAFVYQDMISDPVLKSRYQSFAERQINYVLGYNPSNRSYIVGYGYNPPKHPHHRTAHGSWADSQSIPASHRHVLYGAMVNGPNINDLFSDNISSFDYTYVACDHNAGLVGALAKMCQIHGGTPLTPFPAVESKQTEFFVEAAWVVKETNSIKIKARLNNQSGWPARYIQNLSFRYYMDLSELYNAGYTANDLSISSLEVDPTFGSFSLVQLHDNIWYWEFYFNNNEFRLYPGGPYSGNIIFTITSAGPWDPANDHSCLNLTQTMTKVTNMPVYNGTTPLYGKEPR